MEKKKTSGEKLAVLENLERTAVRDRDFILDVRAKTDAVLEAGDAGAFIAMTKLFDEPVSKEILARSPELLKLRYLMTAVSREQEVGLPLLIRHVNTYDALLDFYDRVTLLLRRLEFDIADDEEEAKDFIRDARISPFAVSAILYNIVSHLGHREKILMKLAEDALAHGLLFEAYGFLNVTENPTPECASLKDELLKVLEGGS